MQRRVTHAFPKRLGAGGGQHPKTWKSSNLLIFLVYFHGFIIDHLYAGEWWAQPVLGGLLIHRITNATACHSCIS